MGCPSAPPRYNRPARIVGLLVIYACMVFVFLLLFMLETEQGSPGVSLILMGCGLLGGILALVKHRTLGWPIMCFVFPPLIIILFLLERREPPIHTIIVESREPTLVGRSTIIEEPVAPRLGGPPDEERPA